MCEKKLCFQCSNISILSTTIHFIELVCFSTEAQEQVTANLANFSYDPLNFDYLREAKAVELFLQLLFSPNSTLTLHAIAGLCNLCLGLFTIFSHSIFSIQLKCPNKCAFFHFTDPDCQQILLNENGIDAISSLLTHSSHKIVENSIATLLQIDSIDTHATIFSVPNRTKVATYQKSSNSTLQNLATVFLETARNVAVPSTSRQAS